MTTQNKAGWIAQDISKAKYLGTLEAPDYHFELMQTDTHFVGGTCSNTGLLESFNFEIDDCYSIEEELNELLHQLDIFYCEGSEATDDCFQHCERM